MVGGQADAVDACREYLDIYSQEVAHMGVEGAGQHTKCSNQIMVVSQMIGVCESLIYGHKAGLKLD
jgi:3-hydroxyisobutyrate dehydrogenase